MRSSICSTHSVLICTLLAAAVALAAPPAYPPTRTVDVVDEVHGVWIGDPYRWLENSDDPEVRAWTEQQNALTRRLLDQFAPQRAELARRLEELHAANVSSVPVIYGQRYFFLKRQGLQNHAVLYVCEGSPAAEARVVLNPNTFSEDGTVALDWWYPSPDGSLIAYGKSVGGSEKSTLYVRDVRTGKDLDLVIPHTRHAAVAWDADGRGFTYTRYPEPGSVPAGDENYHRHVFYHRLGTDWHADAKVWGEGQPKEVMADVTDSSDYRYQFLTVAWGWARNDLYVRRMGETEFRPVITGQEALSYADVLGDRLIIRTNYKASRYRIVAAPVDDPTPEQWQEVLPEEEGVIDAFAIVGGKLVVRLMENAYARLRVHEPDGRLIREIRLPTLGSVGGLSGRPERPELFFSFESFAWPPVVFQCDLRTYELHEIDRMPVRLDPERFVTRQVWFQSRDGTRVPMFVTHRADLVLNGRNPAVLYGYGGFHGSQTPYFYRGGIPWLEAGGVWAVANIRGGGEFGKAWHDAGRLEHKQNCFDDFIAAGEKLIADGYTSKERLGARGGSNGGLLVGAVLVQRPDLFRAIHCAVPLLDMVRYHHFRIARLWIPEYGSAEDPDQFKYLYAYSPYHHIRPGTPYPAVLLTTADNDSRVDPMHARKMAAALQAATSSDRPILLWVETQAGHGAGKPLSKYIQDQLDVWTFFMWQLGVFDTSPASRPGPP
jgi:prolyl oligopeptidase